MTAPSPISIKLGYIPSKTTLAPINDRPFTFTPPIFNIFKRMEGEINENLEITMHTFRHILRISYGGFSIIVLLFITLIYECVQQQFSSLLMYDMSK